MGSGGAADALGSRSCNTGCAGLQELADGGTERRARGDPGAQTAGTREPGALARGDVNAGARARGSGAGRAHARGGARRPAPPRALPAAAASPAVTRVPGRRAGGGGERGERGRPHGAQRALLDHPAPSTARGARLEAGRGARSRRPARVTLGRPRGRTTRLPTSDRAEGETLACGRPTAAAVTRVAPLPQAWRGRVATKSPCRSP